MAAASNLEPTTITTAGDVPSVRYNFSWTFVGQAIYALCQWGMISILAKLGSPVIVGQFALALAISAPVFMFTNLQLRSVQATDARGDFSFADYFGLRLFATASGFAVVVLIVLFSHYDTSTRNVILLVSLTKSFESLSDVVAGLLQKHERLDRVAIGLAVRGLFSLMIFGILFRQYSNLSVAVAGMAITWMLVLLIYDFRCANAIIPSHKKFLNFDVKHLKRLLSLSLPLGFVLALVQLNVNIPRYFLQHNRGSAELGIFASLAYPVISINLVVYALGQSATTRLSRMFVLGQLDKFRTIIWKLVSWGCLILLVGVPAAVVFGRQILTVLYRREYGEHVLVLALLVGVASINAVTSFIACGLSAARCFRPQVPVNVLATVTVTAASAVFVSRYGLGGAAASLMLSAVLSLGGSAWILRNVLRSVAQGTS